jgi:hypothetical protein
MEGLRIALERMEIFQNISLALSLVFIVILFACYKIFENLYKRIDRLESDIRYLKSCEIFLLYDEKTKSERVGIARWEYLNGTEKS